jgi:hypothetical protein
MKGEDILSVKRSDDGRLLVSMRSYDDKNNLVFEIKDNVWTTGFELPWDLSPKHQNITLRHAPRNIGLEIDARNDPIKVRGSFWKDGRWFEGTDALIRDQDGNQWKGVSVANARVAFSF